MGFAPPLFPSAQVGGTGLNSLPNKEVSGNGQCTRLGAHHHIRKHETPNSLQQLSVVLGQTGLCGDEDTLSFGDEDTQFWGMRTLSFGESEMLLLGSFWRVMLQTQMRTCRAQLTEPLYSVLNETNKNKPQCITKCIFNVPEPKVQIMWNKVQH